MCYKYNTYSKVGSKVGTVYIYIYILPAQIVCGERELGEDVAVK